MGNGALELLLCRPFFDMKNAGMLEWVLIIRFGYYIS